MEQAKILLHHSNASNEKWESDLNFEKLCDLVGRAFAGVDPASTEPSLAWTLRDLGVAEEGKDRYAAHSYAISFEIEEVLRKKGMSFGRLEEGNGKSKLISAVVFREYDPAVENKPQSFWSSLSEDFSTISLWLKHQMKGPPTPFEHPWSMALQSLEHRGEKIRFVAKDAHITHGPAAKHWYIVDVAVDSEYQGKGYGRQLMNQLSELADQTGIACYLECFSEKNKLFYEKMGYRHVGTTDIKGDDDSVDLHLYSMIRDPKSEE